MARQMTAEQLIEFYHPKKETWSPFRSLQNYKSMHLKVAKSKGREEMLMNAKTLTQARKICFGNIK